MKKGDEFKVIGNNSKHQFYIGEIVVYDSDEDNGIFPMFYSKHDKDRRSTIIYSDRKPLD
jgi:hypothetical protein